MYKYNGEDKAQPWFAAQDPHISFLQGLSGLTLMG